MQTYIYCYVIEFILVKSLRVLFLSCSFFFPQTFSPRHERKNTTCVTTF